MGIERLAHGLGLGDHVVVALGKLGAPFGQDAQIVVDHGEKLETELEGLAAIVQLAEGPGGTAR
jgi:hypothetical protein